jgi:hypothetical protein
MEKNDYNPFLRMKRVFDGTKILTKKSFFLFS